MATDRVSLQQSFADAMRLDLEDHPTTELFLSAMQAGLEVNPSSVGSVTAQQPREMAGCNPSVQ